MSFPYILKNYNLFIGKKNDGLGTSFAGKVSEVVLPKLEISTVEYTAIGMDMPLDLDMGMKKMTCAMTLRDYNPEVFKLFGLGTRAPASLTLKGATDDENGLGQRRVEIQMKGMWTSIDMGTWAPGKVQEMKLQLTVEYYKLIIAKEELVEIDVINMVRKIGVEDALKETRDTIGL